MAGFAHAGALGSIGHPSLPEWTSGVRRDFPLRAGGRLRHLGGHLLVWVLLLLGLPPEVAAHDPVALLERMAEASHLLNYDGVFVYRRAGGSDSMRIIHRSSREGGAERLMSLSGESREVIRDARGMRCYLPGAGQMLLLREFPRPLMPTEITRPWAQFGEFYTFNLEGEDRIAGRSARIVTVTPKTPDRYGFRLWTDIATGLLLRSDLMNSEGVVLEQVEFLSLELPEHIPDALLEPAGVPGGAQYEAVHAVEGGAGEAHALEWQADWLPAGFRLERAQRLTHGSGDPAFQHLAFSDGLTVLSVFVEATGHAPSAALGFSVLGATVAFSTRVDGYTVTVVGEAPPLTIRRVAEAVTRARR